MNSKLFVFLIITFFYFEMLASNYTIDEKKYNVLFIAVDDLRPELNVYGVSQIISPNIDRLAEQGIVFNQAYCQVPICGASRISLLTGMYSNSTDVYGIKLQKKDKLPTITSLPKHFKNNGYETISIGKIYHHSKDDPEAWSKKPYRAMEGSGYVTEESKEIVKLNQKTNTKAGSKGPVTEAADVNDSLHSDGKLTLKTIRELRKIKNDKPFFLAVGFRKPHLPFTPPKKYWDLYNPNEIDTASNPFWPKNYTKYTMNNFGELRNYYNMPKGKEEVGKDLANHLKHGYYASISFIDAQIGKILDELDVLGLSESTIVVIWGDHGWKLGEHKSWCKHTTFNIDARVPLIVSVPGMKGNGEKSNSLVELVDLYPTLSELCGLSKPKHLEGTSFVPLLDTPKTEWKKAVFSRWVGFKYRYDKEIQIIGHAMGTDRYRYIEYKRTKTGEVLARELYDHKNDLQENENVVNYPDYKLRVDSLARMMSEGWEAAKPESN